MNSTLETKLECKDFLDREAYLLDTQQLDDWLALLTEDITYQVPRRITRERGAEAAAYSNKAFHYKEDIDSLRTRVERFSTEYAWSENPPSSTVRFVGNILIEDDRDTEIDVINNFVLFRSWGETMKFDPILGRRHDRLRRQNGSLKLAERTVYLAHNVLNTHNLSVFL